MRFWPFEHDRPGPGKSSPSLLSGPATWKWWRPPGADQNRTVTIDDGNPATLGPYGFGRFVKAASTADLERLMRGDGRTAVLDEVFRRMPEVFRADRAAGVRAVIHWYVGGRPDGGADHYELVIADGTCTVSPVPAGSPRLTLRLGGVEFLRLATGHAHAVLLVMTGRLRTSGDVALTAKFPSLFDPPKV